MNILIIGSGGREHALAWKAAQSPLAKKVFVAPGNAGTALENNLFNVDIAADNITELLSFATSNHIGLTIVGPEVPLVLGIVDEFKAANLTIFGPTQAAAQLEGSKTFSKDFLKEHHIPTANYASFEELPQAIEYIEKTGAPIVVKADGLAAGKGVIVAQSIQEAKDAVTDMLADNTFGNAGSRVVIEEFLTGEEASFIVMVDGNNVLPMATSQDHKRVGDGDTGPNTGGMGAYSPAPVVTTKVHNKIMQKVIYPTVQGMAKAGTPYTGFLYAGLMIDEKGEPKVIEFNCRFGDPETQPIMLRMQSDLIELCLAACKQQLDKCESKWDKRAAVGVVLASNGYPGVYTKGFPIKGLNSANDNEKIFHAGTKFDNGEVVNAGGRVLCATALGDTISIAQQNAYSLVKKINWTGCFYRKDIAYRALERKL